jgi:hypothetical protein
MPNWCDNKLLIQGPEADLSRMQKEIGVADNPFDLERILPTPGNLAAEDGWYGWRVANWGTKWNVEATLENRSAGEAEYVFMSAWSPPLQALTALSVSYPALMISTEYDEPGGGFAGSMQIQAGRIIAQEEHQIEWDQADEDE